MRALKIDSVAKTITEIDIPKGELLERAYAEIGCDMIEVAIDIEIGDDKFDSVYVDENALIKNSPPPHWFTIEGGHQPFAGSGVVAGLDEEGETVSATISLEKLTSMVTFKSLGEIQAELLKMDTE